MTHSVDPIRVLFVEDSATDEMLVLRELRKMERTVVHERVETAGALREALVRGRWDVILCDWRMPKLGAMEALQIVGELWLDVPVIIVSGTVGEETAVAALRAGARDYVLKDNLMRLCPAIEREMRESEQRSRRHQAERAVEREQARFRALVESGKDGVTITSRDGKLLYASPAALRILGREGEQLDGTPLDDYLHPDERADVRPRTAGAPLMAPGASVTRTRRIVRPDGSVRTLEVTATNWLDDPAVGGIVANFRDVTESQQAMADLVKAQQRFARLFEAGIIGISLNDATGAVVDANDRFLEMVGYTREDVRAGALDSRRMTPREWEAVSEDAGVQLAREGRAKPWEKEYFCKDGSRVPVLTGIAKLDDTTTVSVSMDLSEIKHAENALLETRDQLRQSQKMEAIGLLAGGVAHDFNNLLSVIVGYTDMAILDLRESDPMRADLEQVQEAARRAAGLTRQLLTFSRRQVVEPKVLDLNALIMDTAHLLRRLVGEDIEVVTRLGPPARVRADPGGLEQVVMNLAVNARDAMPRGGRLVIATSQTEIARTGEGAPMPAAGSYVTLEVTDDGVGMDEATQLRVFEPFFTTKEASKGTGLGLSTVFGIVGQSGGCISVQSEKGVGTTFRIDLPLVDAALDAMPSAKGEVVGGTETVLLVEDDDGVRQAVRGILTRAGYDVLEVNQPEAALAIARGSTRPIHLLIADVVMPHLSGTELAARFRAQSPETKVLFISGYTDDEILRRGVLEGQVALLQKPIGRDALLRKLREVLGPRAPMAIP